MSSLPVQKFDAIIIGAGGAGMRASLQLAEAGLRVAVLSKVFPTRSHTVAAQGGIGASLGNMAADNWHWHMYDTIKGSDWLGDQDAIEYMCRMAPQVVYELEHFGMPFDRNPDGTIYQRPFGGHMANFGETPVQRACAAADRTGHAMLHTLYQRNVRANTQFFVEWMALDLVRDAEGDVVGVVAYEMETGAGDDPAGEGDGAGHRRRRADLRGVHQRVHQHRRWPRHGGARRHSAGGPGILAVPSDRRRRRRRPDHRGRARRGRNSAQQRRRALHGALCAERQGPGVARRRVARDGPGDQGRPGLRPGQGSRAAEARSPWPGRDPEAPAVDPRDRDQVRQRRSDQGADPGRADHSLPDGRRADQRARPGRRALIDVTRRQPEFGRRADCMRSANAPACRCTAPTASAPIRCSTCWCSAAPAATSSSTRTCARRASAACPRMPATCRGRAWRASMARRPANRCRRWRNSCAAP